MRGLRIGMRWWLAATFALIAALTVLIVATLASQQSGPALASNAEDLAVGKSVDAAFAVESALRRGTLARSLPAIAEQRDLDLYVFSPHGRLLAQGAKRLPWSEVPAGRDALRSVLAGHRFVSAAPGTGATLVGLPLRRNASAAALVSYAPRPPAYRRSLAVFRHEVFVAAIWAVLAALVLGLLAAALIARRLRAIAGAAAAIEQGDFGVRLKPLLHDEVGSLATTIDRMRRRLDVSFQQLRAERDRLGRLLDRLHEGVLAVDAQPAVQFANPRARALLAGIALEPGSELPETWNGAPLRSLAESLFAEEAEVREVRVDAEEQDRVFSIVGVPAAGSELAVLVIEDVTEQERRERAEREFVANASHELRTPVTAIASAVEALLAGAKDEPAERDAFVEVIRRQTRRLTRLTQSLLILARAQERHQPIELEPIRVRPLLEEVAATSVGGEGRLGIVCPPDLVALGQRDLALQVFSNLVENALKHGDGGRVTLAGRRDDGAVVVEVADEGGGIAPATRERIFDRFFSGDGGRRSGFGLGLAIVRDAVRALDGQVEIEALAGRGTVARVVLRAGGER